MAEDGWRLEVVVKEFIDWGGAQGYSPATVKNYKSALEKEFLGWAQSQGLTYIEDVTQRVIDAYQVFIRTRERRDGREGSISPATLAFFVRPLRTMTLWAEKRGAEIGGLEIRKPVQPKKLVRILNDDELRKLETRATQMGVRDYLIIWLLGRRGLRADEVTLITLDDLLEERVDNRIEHFVRVMGKGSGGHGNERKVPVPIHIYRDLAKLANNPPPGCPTGRVFWSKRHGFRRDSYNPITYKAVYALVSALGLAVLKRNVNPHLLRHTFITKCSKRGLNDHQIDLYAGNHTSIKSYIHLTHQDAPEILRAADLD